MSNIIKKVWDQTPSIIKYPIVSVAGLALAVFATSATETKIEFPLTKMNDGSTQVQVSLLAGWYDDRAPFVIGRRNQIETVTNDPKCVTGVRVSQSESLQGLGVPGDGDMGGISHCASN